MLCRVRLCVTQGRLVTPPGGLGMTPAYFRGSALIFSDNTLPMSVPVREPRGCFHVRHAVSHKGIQDEPDTNATCGE